MQMTDKKMWFAIIGLAGLIGAKVGFYIDSETAWQIVMLVGLLIAAQGASEWGKYQGAGTQQQIVRMGEPLRRGWNKLEP